MHCGKTLYVLVVERAFFYLMPNSKKLNYPESIRFIRLRDILTSSLFNCGKIRLLDIKGLAYELGDLG